MDPNSDVAWRRSSGVIGRFEMTVRWCVPSSNRLTTLHLEMMVVKHETGKVFFQPRRRLDRAVAQLAPDSASAKPLSPSHTVTER